MLVVPKASRVTHRFAFYRDIPQYCKQKGTPMNDAWMVRASERQELLEKLKREVMEKEEEYGRREFDYDLAHVCLHFFQSEDRIGRVATYATRYFEQVALPAITEFARATEECDVLVCDLLAWLTESITIRFRSDLTHKEIMEPKVIFHADTATTQI